MHLREAFCILNNPKLSFLKECNKSIEHFLNLSKFILSGKIRVLNSKSSATNSSKVS